MKLVHYTTRFYLYNYIILFFPRYGFFLVTLYLSIPLGYASGNPTGQITGRSTYEEVTLKRKGNEEDPTRKHSRIPLPLRNFVVWEIVKQTYHQLCIYFTNMNLRMYTDMCRTCWVFTTMYCIYCPLY